MPIKKINYSNKAVKRINWKNSFFLLSSTLPLLKHGVNRLPKGNTRNLCLHFVYKGIHGIFNDVSSDTSECYQLRWNKKSLYTNKIYSNLEESIFDITNRDHVILFHNISNLTPCQMYYSNHIIQYSNKNLWRTKKTVGILAGDGLDFDLTLPLKGSDILSMQSILTDALEHGIYRTYKNLFDYNLIEEERYYMFWIEITNRRYGFIKMLG